MQQNHKYHHSSLWKQDAYITHNATWETHETKDFMELFPYFFVTNSIQASFSSSKRYYYIMLYCTFYSHVYLFISLFYIYLRAAYFANFSNIFNI